jgi:MFS family permease
MGLVAALETLPTLFFGLVAGALADRWDRRRTMLCCDAGRAILTGLIPLSYLLRLPTMPVIYAVVAPIGLLGCLFGAAYTASVPNLVAREQIGPANSYFEALESFAWIFGPGVAGVLAGWIGPGPTLALDAVSFLASAASLAFVRRRLQSFERRSRQHLLRDIQEGVTYIARHPLLRALIALWSVSRVFSIPFVVAVTYFVTVDRGLPTTTVGIVISAYAAGSLVGTLVAGRLTNGRLGFVALLADALLGAATVAVALSGNVPLLLVATFAFGCMEGVMLIAYLTLRSTIAPDALLGRVSSVSTTLTLGLTSLGYLAVGALLDAARGRTTLLLMGIAIMGIGLLFALSPHLRRARAV